MAAVADTGANLLAVAASLMVMLAAGPGASETRADEGPLAVAEVLAGDLVRLADGRTVRLAGIRVSPPEDGQAGPGRFAEQARRELSALLEGRAIRLAPSEMPYDRYGRLVAQIERADGLWLQGALLERGLAQVQTRPGEAARADRMLALEQTARAGRRGLWADPELTAQDASAVDGRTGRFRIVRGRVLRVASTERYVYLNFGADWRTDFTVRVRRAALSGALAGLDRAGLAGRLVEVRGIVLEAGGPLIELSHPAQMQVVP
jgi:micrococcal nuclease